MDTRMTIGKLKDGTLIGLAPHFYDMEGKEHRWEELESFGWAELRKGQATFDCTPISQIVFCEDKSTDTRIHKVLDDRGVHTVSQLELMNLRDLKTARNSGAKCYNVVKGWLDKHYEKE